MNDMADALNSKARDQLDEEPFPTNWARIVAHEKKVVLRRWSSKT